jgi:uncharacterized protein (TIGR00255 family)
MTIKSMTGFARVEGASGGTRWAWELKTVNGRNLEVRTRAPAGFDAVAEEARRLVLAALSRGQGQLTLTLAAPAAAPRIRIDRERLAGLLSSLSGLDLPPGIGPASLDGLLAIRGVVEVEDAGEGAAEEAALRADLLAAVAGLVDGIVAARAGEGAALSSVLAGLLDRIAALVKAAESSASRQPEAVKARLAEQVAALLDASQALDPQRLHQEAALLAARADIREELDRLRAHLASAREILSASGAVGRRLDFLAQEFGREANTLCAKAGDVELSRIGLDLKVVVEQFREQVANVE